MKKRFLLNFPYLVLGLYATKIGQAYRLSPGTELSEKMLHILDGFALAFQSPFPSFQLLDLCVGILCGAALRLSVYLKSKSAKKYRRNAEYGRKRRGAYNLPDVPRKI